MVSFIIGGIYAILSIGLGAFGEHALKDVLEPSRLQTLETASTYLMYTAIPLLILSTTQPLLKWPKLVSILFGLSGALFSGSLILYIATDIKWLVFITPIGGGLMLLSWVIWIIIGLKQFNR